MKRVILSVCCLIVGAGALRAESFRPELKAARTSDWKFVEGRWRLTDGELEQQDPKPLTVAILKEPVFGDFTLQAEFNIHSVGDGVRAAAIAFRATGTMSYYWLHLDSKNGGAILTRSTPENEWIEIARKGISLKQDEWHTVRVECKGPQIAVTLDSGLVFDVRDAAVPAGRIGFGASQGSVAFRNIEVEGTPAKEGTSLRNERPPYRVISRGELAGPYQAFPDACRLANGDIVAVFYAGYGHISFPNEMWPRGGRICLVRSQDEGQTWSAPQVLFDGPLDDRDPHIAALRDGSLQCTFFTYRKEGNRERYDTCVAASRDGGEIWETEPRVLARDWACSAPIREMKDGTLLLGIYTEADKTAYGGVVRSTDGGKTWSEPIAIDPKSRVRLDAETDVIQLNDGSVFAALRGDHGIHMHYSISPDLGKTWSPVKDIGFVGHCPHLTRLSSGEILLTHRLPNTALHISRDDGRTWGEAIQIDSHIGAYPATVELKDHTVLIVYYEEGAGSAIRSERLKITKDGVTKVPWETGE